MNKLTFFFFLFTALAYANDDVIEFHTPIGVKKLNLEQLQKQFVEREVSTYNLDTKRIETFLGFSMDNIIHSFWSDVKEANNFVQIECHDGYIAYIEAKKFRTNRSYIAYKLKGNDNFVTIDGYQKKIVDLGRFYLVWKESYKKGADTRRRHHWPWSIKSIKIINELPDDIKPLKTASDDVNWGYLNFVKQCLTCHKLNGFGGEVGPDLMLSENWKKQDDKWLMQYISDPKSLNKDSKMSRFPKYIDIREVRIRNISLYLRHLTGLGEDKKEGRFLHSELEKILEQKVQK
ncbi:MAG: hypothetical protein EP326_11495 [Deltaproteobacteria bacterium]|nr:MAG: hypothetical protein EP326_11495 [Deltaproteobacteria bacterium]